MSHSVGCWKLIKSCHLKLIKVSTSTQGKSWMFRYSMIGAHIIYNMWKNVGQRPTFVMVGESEEKREKTSQVKHKLSDPFFCWINRLECFSETWLERLGIGTLSRPPCSGTIWAKWIYHHPSILAFNYSCQGHPDNNPPPLLHPREQRTIPPPCRAHHQHHWHCHQHVSRCHFSSFFFLHFNLKVDVLRHSHGLLPGPAAKVAFDHNLHRCLSQTIIVFVLIVISSNPSPLPSKVCPRGGRARPPAHHLRLRDLLVRELHHHCRLSQVRREIVGIFFRHPALSFFFSNNALEPSSLVICNGIVELVQVDNQTKTFFLGFSPKEDLAITGQLATFIHCRLEAQMRCWRTQEDKTRTTGSTRPANLFVFVCN